jgi:hypothetical protein
MYFSKPFEYQRESNEIYNDCKDCIKKCKNNLGHADTLCTQGFAIGLLLEVARDVDGRLQELQYSPKQQQQRLSNAASATLENGPNKKLENCSGDTCTTAARRALLLHAFSFSAHTSSSPASPPHSA